MRRIVPFAVLLPLIGCGAVPPHASLPPDAVAGVGDPTRAAIIGSAYAFNTPSAVAGRPDAAAQAAAQVEHLATEIPAGPRWVEFNPSLAAELRGARDDVRAALGVEPAALPQAVVDGLYAASRALRTGDRAAAANALAPPAFRDGRATLARLDALPALPRVGTATALTERELRRVDQIGQNGADGGGDGRS